MRYSRASSLFFDTPLELLPAKAEEILAFWRSKLAGLDIDAERFEGLYEPVVATIYEMDDWFATGGKTEDKPEPGSIAVLPLHGILGQRMNMMLYYSGGTSTELFAAEFNKLVNNPDIKAIVCDIDSPGGSVYGLSELADVIFAARGAKPMVAQVNSLAASAAYHIASQFPEIVVTPGADVGHIGVSMLHLNYAQQVENEGIKPYLITAGKYKHEQAQGANLVPVSDEALADWQARVDEVYGRFVSAVARGRGVKPADVRTGFGEGRVVGAAEAVKLGMADRVGTLEQTIARLASGGRRGGRRAELSAETESPADEEPENPKEDEDEESNNAEAHERLGRFRLKAFQARAAAGAA